MPQVAEHEDLGTPVLAVIKCTTIVIHVENGNEKDGNSHHEGQHQANHLEVRLNSMPKDVERIVIFASLRIILTMS